MSNRVEVRCIDTLMRWTGEAHAESGDRQCFYYFSVPESWLAAADLQAKVYGVATGIYAAHNQRFRQSEPSDLGYLRVKATFAKLLSDAEDAAAPWHSVRNPAVWEWTPCVVIEPDGSFKKVDRQDF